MPIPSSPPVGAIAYGRSGVGYPITRLEGASVVLRTKNGLLRVPLSAIQRWKPPPQEPLEQTKPIEVGDTVQLKGTCRTYRVVRLYQTYCGQGEYQDWAELEGPCGAAFWPVEQLEVT
ncbi:hypothetical protein HRE53_22785 [Acaryochloris sp. 'Moss Beach']|uniref:hypothetical protein n=1 Tax=Acaryochloris sp. 'Moss Beach' TaxID=2740837 RepID=UPI001F39DB1D|nr:hypothetical protein [Acaryochloris sp. 'Moss Beach']UJB69181.1 hypothetical protein HRE53_22785 [Acaryochloris sp. 'Moss Beach']